MAATLLDPASTPGASDPRPEPSAETPAPAVPTVDQLRERLRTSHGETEAARSELLSLRRMLKAERLVRRELEQKQAAPKPDSSGTEAALQQQLARAQQQLAAQRRAFEAAEAARQASETARLAAEAEMEGARRKLTRASQLVASHQELKTNNETLQKALDLAADELAGLEIRAESAEKDAQALCTAVARRRLWGRRLFWLGLALGLAAGAAAGWFSQGLL